MLPALAALALWLLSWSLVQDLGWPGLALILGTATAAVLLRIWLVEAPKYARAERLWMTGAAPEEVLGLLRFQGLVRGELGHRWALLRGKVNLALGQRDQAWSDFLEAHLLRIPAWRRLFVRRLFRTVLAHPTARDISRGERRLRALPHLGRLHHLQGIWELRRGGEDAEARAWRHFERALPLSWFDPLLLEDLFLAAVERPERLAQADLALALLLRHHGDPRTAWDRASAARYLVGTGRHAEAVALISALSPETRTKPWHWAALAIGLRTLGDLEGAGRALEQGLSRHPGSFRLWMERFGQAMARGEDGLAEDSLRQAQRCLPQEGEPGPLTYEWRVHKAEFEHWVRGDETAARRLLEDVPYEHQGDHHPPLRLQILVAQGDFEAAHQQLAPLLERHPGDLDLLLMQADVLAGLEAWKALLPFLDQLPEGAQNRALYWHLRGLALIHLGEAGPSRSDLERAAHMEPNNLRFVLDAGHACAELGDWERSELHWRQALRLEAANEEALVQLADSRRACHDERGALALLRECLSHHPHSEEAQVRLAELEAN